VETNTPAKSNVLVEPAVKVIPVVGFARGVPKPITIVPPPLLTEEMAPKRVGFIFFEESSVVRRRW
jgi:hypothetical protein